MKHQLCILHLVHPSNLILRISGLSPTCSVRIPPVCIAMGIAPQPYHSSTDTAQPRLCHVVYTVLVPYVVPRGHGTVRADIPEF
jgi:hypothetical protein